MGNKIIRTICCFSHDPSEETLRRLGEIENVLKDRGFEIQTKRICSNGKTFQDLGQSVKDESILLNIGTIPMDEAKKQMGHFLGAEKGISFNVDLTSEEINTEHAELLFEIIKGNSARTFQFSYVFNDSPSSPYFPSATYEKEGFSIGLQPNDLADGCNSLEEWFNRMKDIWDEIDGLFGQDKDYLGIDSSIAPLFEGKSSLINFIKAMRPSFNDSVVSDVYMRITKFIKESNPKPIGLCGLMFPCLEDFELAQEYEKGNFSIERNIFLSLHSGLGIDTYPIGVDEELGKVVDILKTIQGLSNKYKKPLSARFVSDGKAKIGEKTDFMNQYLKDVIIRKL
ncbi:MAG: DUF711 family protein [Candidatus Moranbacteria bacterium]|nr:DUF711 family protein [Candidatus Moranbacteria bacterium]